MNDAGCLYWTKRSKCRDDQRDDQKHGRHNPIVCAYGQSRTMKLR
jgi:hypothetical protein